MEARALELAGQRHPGVPVLLRVSGGIEGASVRPMLERRGYAVVRYYHEMARPIPGVLPPAPELPVQPVLGRAGRGGPAGPQRRLQHPLGFGPDDRRAVAELVASRTFRPDCSFVSLDDSGEVQAYVLVCQWVAGEAWVQLVGTRQRARGAGLARACLAAAVRAMAEQGYASAGLGVDSQNSSGAGALYASLGFRLQRVIAHYGRVEPAR